MRARVRLRAGAWLRAARVIGLAGALGGCALMAPQSAELGSAVDLVMPERVELATAPFFPQPDQQCGPAALATTMGHAGVRVTPEALAQVVYLPDRGGSLQVEMLAAPRRHGLVTYPLEPRLDALLREVAAGTPVIVLQDYGVWPVPLWHYAVVVGYDHGTREVVLRSGEKPRLVMPYIVLEYTWKKSGYWAMAVMPPDRIPVGATRAETLTAVAAMGRAGSREALQVAYTAMLRRWPDDVAAYIGLANAHHESGGFAEAEAILRRAAVVHPDSVAVLNNLAMTVSDLGRHEEALQLVEQAIAGGGPLLANARETRETIVHRRAGSP